jgi:dehydrogenase/reductase SDR family protein 12
MPDFYNKMKDKLRTVEQGSDTIVWLALAKSAVVDPKNKGGQFFQVGLKLSS